MSMVKEWNVNAIPSFSLFMVSHVESGYIYISFLFFESIDNHNTLIIVIIIVLHLPIEIVITIIVVTVTFECEWMIVDLLIWPIFDLFLSIHKFRINLFLFSSLI